MNKVNEKSAGAKLDAEVRYHLKRASYSYLQ